MTIHIKRFVIPTIELCGLIAAAIFGVQWYLNPDGKHEAAFALSGVVTLFFEWFRRHLRTSVEINVVSTFIEEGRKLKARKAETPLPINDYNDWVKKMELYFQKAGRPDYLIRLSDFSGLTFYCDGSEKSRFSNAVDGRLRRLHEFLHELATAAN